MNGVERLIEVGELSLRAAMPPHQGA